VAILLKIEWASRVFEFDNPGELEDEAGDLLSPSSTGRSVSFSDLFFPVDVAELVEAGHDLAAAVGEVSIDGRVVVRGFVSEPVYGGANEPVSLTVADDPYNDRGLIPGATEVVPRWAYSERWGDVDAPYPIVFGTPGGGSDEKHPGTPAPIWARIFASPDDTESLLIAGHRISAAGTFRVYDTEGGGVDFAATYLRDNIDPSGRAITALDISLVASAIDLQSSEYYIAWGSGSIGLPGGAGDVIGYLLERSTLAVDWDRFSEIRGVLNHYELAAFIDEPVAPWEYIDSLNEWLPISWVSGASGVFPVLWRLDARAHNAQHAFNNETRSGLVNYERDRGDIINEVQVNFARNIRADTYTESVTVRDELSIDRYGLSSESVDLDVVYDKKTAYQIGRDRLAANAWIHRVVSYQINDDRGVQPGDIVKVTDDDLHLSEAPGLARRVKFTGGGVCSVEVLLLSRGV
jgi:hypothetical protein